MAQLHDYTSKAPAFVAARSTTGQALAIRYDTAGLAPGEHTTTITALSDDSYNSPQTVSVKITVETIIVDSDGDGDVDQRDFGHFQACLSGTAVTQNDPDCQNARLDGDTDVDSNDLAVFLGCLSGPNSPPIQDCMD